MKKRKIILALLVFVLVIGTGVYLKTQAGTSQTGSGWPWGGSEDSTMGGVVGSPPPDGNETGVGWINLNCKSEVQISPGVMASLRICNGGANNLKSCNGPGAVACGAGISCTDACTVLANHGVDYGVNIPASGGNLSGYAWNENLGWISFQEPGPYPAVASGDDYAYQARRASNNIRGWARIMSIPQAGANAGGWQGWIRLHSDPNDPFAYGVTIVGNSLSGFGWNGENEIGGIKQGLGYIDFSKAKIDITDILNISFTASPNSCVGCGSLTSTLTATRLATSNTTGNITYEFDCESDGTIDGNYTTVNTSQTHNCTYSSSSTAWVRVTQGISQTSTAPVALIPAVCDNGVVEGIEECDEGASNGACPSTCSATCSNNNCSTSPWIEVAP
jgi:hypothetical protein